MTPCAACPHLRTAHTVPDGRCLLCGCPGWSEAPPNDADALTRTLDEDGL